MEENKLVSDIKARLMPNLPVPGGVGDFGQRAKLEQEWKTLEKRIEEYYINRKELIQWLDEMYIFNRDARELAFEVKDDTTPQIYLAKMHFIREILDFIGEN